MTVVQTTDVLSPKEILAEDGQKLADHVHKLCRDFAFPVLQWQAKYEGIYLLGTSIARPLIAKACLQVAREVGADGTPFA